jgi:hypothetical protein
MTLWDLVFLSRVPWLLLLTRFFSMEIFLEDRGIINACSPPSAPERQWWIYRVNDILKPVNQPVRAVGLARNLTS